MLRTVYEKYAMKWVLFVLKLNLATDVITLCGHSSTLYVGLQHVVSLTNVNSSRYFSRLKWVYPTQTSTSTKHCTSSLHSHRSSEVVEFRFYRPTKTRILAISSPSM